MVSEPSASEIFRSLGVDVHANRDIHDLRDDLEWIRRSRRSEADSRASLRTGLWALVAAVLGSALATLGSFFSAAFGKH